MPTFVGLVQGEVQGTPVRGADMNGVRQLVDALKALKPKESDEVLRISREIAADKNNTALYAQRARQLAAEGKPDAAMADVKSALRLDPDNGSLHALRKELRAKQ